jgi:hypothetical protein
MTSTRPPSRTISEQELAAMLNAFAGTALPLAEPRPTTARRNWTSRYAAAFAIASAAVAAFLLFGLPGLHGGKGTIGSASAATNVRELHAFKHAVRPRAQNALPASVSEVINLMATRLGTHPSNIQEPIIGAPSIYLVSLGSTHLCMIVALHGATAFCRDSLRQAEGSLQASRSIVDGKMFITGLAADNVKTITVTTANTPSTQGSTIQARIVNNVFVARLPYTGGGSGATTITVTRTDGTTGTLELHGLPEPIGAHP